MLTEKDYCDYDTCVALIEMGFVGTSRYYYDKKNHKLHITNYGITYTVRTASASEYILAIPLYDAQKWLREEHNLHIEVRYYQNLWYEYELKEAEGKILAEGSAFKTYEDALNTAVYMAIEHLKGK